MKIGVVDERLTRELRRTVLRPALCPGEPLPGDDIPDGAHLAATADDGTVLSTCFVYPDPCPWLPQRADAWHLRQMATVEGMRGQGIGGQLLDAAVRYTAEHGARLIWCNAREAAAGFYRRRGFRPHGEVFLDEQLGIPHLRMWRELAGGSSSSS